MQDYIARYGRRAEIADVRVSPHTFRHTFAVIKWRNGTDMLTLSRALGHGDVKTTEGYLRGLGVEDVLTRQRECSPLESIGFQPVNGARLRGRPVAAR